MDEVSDPEIALAASPREWSLRLHRQVADHGGARVRVTALQAQDVLEEHVDVFIADDTTSFLTARLVSELHRRGSRVLGVFDPEDPRGKGELLELGVDDLLERSASAEAFVAAIATLAGTTPLTGIGVLPERAPPPTSADRPQVGQITAVAASSGGCGATEVALALASIAARRTGSTVLIDGDEVAPSIGQRLGLPLYPNLRAAVDVVEQQRTPLEETLVIARGGIAVLVGLAGGRDWAELRSQQVLDVVQSLAAISSHAIVNSGPLLEDLPAQGGPARFSQTRTLLGRADAIVGVGLPTPIGVARLLEWAADVRALAPSTPVHLVLNRAPASHFRQGEVEQEIRRTFWPASITFAPVDGRVPAAAWTSRPVADGPFMKAIAGLAAQVLQTSHRKAGGRPPATARRGSRRRAKR